MTFIKTTEQDSKYNHLEEMSVSSLLSNMNTEDTTVPSAVAKSLPQITILTEKIVKKLENGGRLFYIGAGTSGRLGVLDASECPPTFGVSYDLVIGLIAGGDIAIRQAVEFAEDSKTQGWLDLKAHHVSQFPVEVLVGPEFVTGSSRMKAGTAQKLVLNMISTATMIRLGKIKGNKMVDMQLSNKKLVARGQKMLATELNINQSEASLLLEKYGNVRNSIKNYKK